MRTFDYLGLGLGLDGSEIQGQKEMNVRMSEKNNHLSVNKLAINLSIPRMRN